MEVSTYFLLRAHQAKTHMKLKIFCNGKGTIYLVFQLSHLTGTWVGDHLNMLLVAQILAIGLATFGSSIGHSRPSHLCCEVFSQFIMLLIHAYMCPNICSQSQILTMPPETGKRYLANHWAPI